MKRVAARFFFYKIKQRSEHLQQPYFFRALHNVIQHAGFAHNIFQQSLQ